MNYNYILINEDFIKRISDEKREVLKDIMYKMYRDSIGKNTKKLSREIYFKSLNKVKIKIMCSYCAYCKRLHIIGIQGKLEDVKVARYCVSCGESNIYEKANLGLKKVNNLLEVSGKLDEVTDKELVDDLNQQILVLIATKMEVFFRDYYTTFLNMKIVKSGHSEIERFEKDCKNDFINIDKTNDRFKKELGINLKSTIGNDMYKDMKEISAYRNVIVHNNGICDKKFLGYGIGTYNVEDTVKVKFKDINRYLETTKEAIRLVGKIYEDMYLDEVIEELENGLPNKVEV